MLRAQATRNPIGIRLEPLKTGLSEASGIRRARKGFSGEGFLPGARCPLRALKVLFEPSRVAEMPVLLGP